MNAGLIFMIKDDPSAIYILPPQDVLNIKFLLYFAENSKEFTDVISRHHGLVLSQ
jgi:hypothetical protein